MLLQADVKMWMVSLIIMFAVRPTGVQDSNFKMFSMSPVLKKITPKLVKILATNFGFVQDWSVISPERHQWNFIGNHDAKLLIIAVDMYGEKNYLWSYSLWVKVNSKFLKCIFQLRIKKLVKSWRKPRRHLISTQRARKLKEGKYCTSNLRVTNIILMTWAKFSSNHIRFCIEYCPDD